MSFVGRNNAKITARPSGGGSKLQGITSTTDRSALAIRAVQNRAWGAQNRHIIFCLNQLGGVGRHKSQFHTPADGVQGCDPWKFYPQGTTLTDGNYNGRYYPESGPVVDGGNHVSNNGKTLNIDLNIHPAPYNLFNFQNLDVSGTNIPCNAYVDVSYGLGLHLQVKIVASYNDRNTVGYLGQECKASTGGTPECTFFILLKHGRLQNIVSSIERDSRLKQYLPYLALTSNTKISPVCGV